MKDFWYQLSEGHKDAIVFVFVCACSIGMVATAVIALIITVHNFPT